ncbi:MAG: hypothetical protein ACLS6W_05100 [Ruminococcus sp.]
MQLSSKSTCIPFCTGSKATGYPIARLQPELPSVTLDEIITR